jgi:broad specificity polyphosphatase/5'/3'-nucleotidase SurE
MTKLSKLRFYLPTAPQRKAWSERGSTGYQQVPDASTFAEDTDVHAVIVKRQVAVTPVSMDMTARVSMEDLEKQLREP